MSAVDETLRYMRIADEELLLGIEQEFAGAIKLGPAGRYGCRMLVKGEMFEFTLGHLPDGSDTFFVTKGGKPFDAQSGSYNSLLYRLIRHRAAELIGSVRAGHAEYNQRPRKKVKAEP